MKKLMHFLPLLFAVTLVLLVVGYLLTDSNFTTLLPYFIVNGILCVSTLSWTATKKGLFKKINAGLLIVNTAASLLFLFKLIPIQTIWIYIVASLIVGITLFLQDLIQQVFSQKPKLKKFIQLSVWMNFLISALMFFDLNTFSIAVLLMIINVLAIGIGLFTAPSLYKSTETI